MSWLERKIPLPVYTDPRDEKINTDTHLLGSILAVATFILVLFLCKSMENLSLRGGMITYAVANILLYLSSTLYHALKKGNAKRIFRIFDHSSIYILIAATYTPILTYVGSEECMNLLMAMWAIVVLGITVTILFWEKLKVVHVILYLVMGWLCVFFYSDIFPFIPEGIMKFMILGGISYTSGLLFYAVKKIPHYHGIWHLFVLMGSIFFYVGILMYLT